jgi:lysophospholipase L1-like esterase
MSGNNRVQLLINSSKREEIQNMIMKKLDRGVTLLHGKTGYFKHSVDLILSVLDVRELALAKSYIYSIDPNAFIIVSKVSEVSGRGFSTDKVHEKGVCEMKNILFIGDSKASVEFTGSMLDDVFADFNVKLLRDTIPGATFVPYDTIGVVEHIDTRLYEQMAASVDQIDYIVIQRSCNDIYYSTLPNTTFKLGTPLSTNENEMYGAIKYAIDYFTTLCPAAEIIFTTCTYRYDVNKEEIIKYNKNLKELAYNYPNVRVFDLDLVCGVNENNYQEYYIDGVHQNPEGVELWKKCYTKYFETFLK